MVLVMQLKRENLKLNKEMSPYWKNIFIYNYIVFALNTLWILLYELIDQFSMAWRSLTRVSIAKLKKQCYLSLIFFHKVRRSFPVEKFGFKTKFSGCLSLTVGRRECITLIMFLFWAVVILIFKELCHYGTGYRYGTHPYSP